MTAVGKALGLATLNVFVIAYALSIEIRAPMETIVVFSIIPALLLGAILGCIAESTSEQRPLWRFMVLALPACGLVVVLASAFEMMHFAPHACIPTFVAASILERTTRKPQTVPVAAVE